MMLEILDLTASHGHVQALHGLNLSLRHGEIHLLLGRNGAGKTTLLRRVMGLLPPQTGQLRLDGSDISGWPTPRIARAGIAYAPEGREVFASLSVRENLMLAGRIGGTGWTTDRVIALFPALAVLLDRSARFLSGGEQQMLAIGRALMTSPRVLMLDEPTEGLAAPVVAQLAAALVSLKGEGLTILLVEQNVGFALPFADRVTLISGGRDVWQGDPDGFANATDIRNRYLGA